MKTIFNHGKRTEFTFKDQADNCTWEATTLHGNLRTNLEFTGIVWDAITNRVTIPLIDRILEKYGSSK